MIVVANTLHVLHSAGVRNLAFSVRDTDVHYSSNAEAFLRVLNM